VFSEANAANSLLATLDDGARLAVIVENIKPGWLLRRAKFVATRIIVLYDGR
jgi:hypothetical protein